MKNYSSSELLRVKNEVSNSKITNDYTKACDEIIPIARRIALNTEKGSFDEAIDLLFHLEKLTRIACDAPSSTRVLVEIVELCAATNNHVKLNDFILVCAKRSTSKEAITRMVQECITVIKTIPDSEIKVDLLKTLCKVTEGKVYVEIERAQLTEMLADVMERDGNTENAAKLLSDVKVEAIGTMDMKDKVKLILHQMRLLIAVDNYPKAQIISQKVFKKTLDGPDMEPLKLQFYSFKIELDRHSEFLKTSQHYLTMAECKSMASCQRRSITANCILYCILAPYNNEQKDMMENIAKMEAVKEIPVFKSILDLFLALELINLEDFVRKYFKVLNKYEVFSPQTQHGKKCWNELKNRIIEHNILVMSKFYSRIYLDRLAEFLHLSRTECEEQVAKLVINGSISVKIDRVSEIVEFKRSDLRNPNSILNDWTNTIDVLMKQVNRASNLIHNEVCLIGANNCRAESF